MPHSVSPIPLTQRKTVPASPAEIASSAKHKSVGAGKFKLGQYGEAEAAYTVAISLLPEAHLLLVPLYNNRALARLKTGDHTGAVEDATTVIGLVGPSYHPQREAKVTTESEGASVDLSDGLVKAWRRRAEAYEGKEKWALAQKDWEAVAAANWAGGKLRSEAVGSAGRCRRTANANNADSGGRSTSTTKFPVKRSSARPSVPSPPVRRGPTPPSQALSKLREANKAAEAEDQARHELKDTIDARLLAWKGGKETNIRALIASLDSVLWPELGWQKVGMGDVISPSQVKIRYTKAIAKLHPDKLNANNTNLEQRMTANAVFGTLNEAWNSFKQ
jgi:tetratricopeptide (TPR) repeat protein